MKKSIKHDLGSLFFKLKSSINLLKDDISKDEKEILLDILEKEINKLQLLCSICSLDLEKYTPKKQKININDLVKIEKDIYIETDGHLFKLLLDSLQYLLEEGQTNFVVKDKEIFIEGKINLNSELKQYLFDFIKNVSKKIHINIETTTDGVHIKWTK